MDLFLKKIPAAGKIRLVSQMKKLFLGSDWIIKIIFVFGIILWTLRFINYLPIKDAGAARILALQQVSVWDLFHTPWLDHYVHDGRGFLILTKVFSLFLPNHELAYRFPIFICSLLGWFLFLRLTRHFLTSSGRCVAMWLYIICPFLIEHSGLMMPYACDVSMSSFLLLMLFHLAQSDLKSRKLRLGYALGGGLAVVTSLPAVFVLAGCGGVVLIQMLMRREKHKIKRFLPVLIFWFVFWTLYYFYFIHHFTHWDMLLNEWGAYFLPLGGGAGQCISWFLGKFTEMFKHPIGLSAWIGMPFWLLGIIAFLHKDRLKLFLLISPLCILLAALILRKYPFHGRVVAFLLPMNLILIGRGWQWFFKGLSLKKFGRILAIIIGCLLFVPQSIGVINRLVYTHKVGGTTAAMDTIAANWQPGDGIYVHNTFNKTFQFLNQRYGFHRQDYILGVCLCDDQCRTEMQALPPYRRIWFILRYDDMFGVKMIHYFADQNGKFQNVHWQGPCRTFLYEWDLNHAVLP